MSGRRRSGLWIAGILGVVAVAALTWVVVSRSRHGGLSSVVYDARTPLPVLTNGLREGDARALLVLFPRVAPQGGSSFGAVTDVEAKELVEVLNSMRIGFLRFGGYGRISSLMMVTKILERFGVEGAPAGWIEGLRPVHELFASGLADGDLQTRVTALNEVGKLWSWFPGRTMMPDEETKLVEWKSGLYAPVLRRLADREPHARAAAVACLGNLHDDQAASPALAYLDDRTKNAGIVRLQVLSSFAARPALLSEDAILKRLQDPEPAIVEAAEVILRTRGLTHEQIDLGRLIFDPKPEYRASVIPRLRNRTDIDPVVWLLQLSNDANETVRKGAAEALAERTSPEVLQRLGEMARSDESAVVRQVAARFVPAAAKTETARSLPLPLPLPLPRSPGVSGSGTSGVKAGATVALPPLPGSSLLNPRAN